ncbi:up-regulator of cell proliferation-like [Engraulis encrasicolus]|uniref:up-regulator of cell proliferation-like n=1 Tax=Engraulis encrasicolus TaxID=184585 RepID=UPI002FCEEC22
MRKIILCFYFEQCRRCHILDSDEDVEHSKESQKGLPLSELLSALGLRHLQGGKLTLSSVLEINSSTLYDLPPQGPKQVPWSFLKKFLMAHSNSRNIQCAQDQLLQRSSFTEDDGGCNLLNPLDLITALLHCADPFLQQKMVSKMSLCQFAVPLLLPNCDTQQSTLMLWAMRDIVKKYKSGDGRFVEGRIMEMDIPMVSFVRVGECSLPKSQFLNTLLSNHCQPNEAFIHHGMPCRHNPRGISDGLVEVSWYMPCGNDQIDIFKQPVAVANLRGDSRLFGAQVSFLCQTSAAVFIFSDDLDVDLSPFTNTERKAELYLVTNSKMKNYNMEKLEETCRKYNLKMECVIIRRKQNDSEFVNVLRFHVQSIVASYFVKPFFFDLADIAPQIGVLADEDFSECRKGRGIVEGITGMVKDIVGFKEEQLPLHGTMWRKISQLEKERCRMKNATNEHCLKQYRSSLIMQETALRREQHQRASSASMVCFLFGISQPKPERLYFLQWLKIQLDTLTRHDLSILRHQYKDCCNKNPQNKTLIKSLDEQIFNCSLGPEHFFRELGQIYECACSQPQDHPVSSEVHQLPDRCAQMLLDGFPVELVDGEASHISMKWISAVLTQLHQLVDKKSRMLVLTVLGGQSTGKSTLLNTMFGVQFAVSNGRCTRGAFMLLIKVSEDVRPELKCDFIMLIDTEGLRSPELAALDTSNEHDNELATLAIGLSDITIINVAMENNQERKDILQIAVHASMKMREVGKKPRCLFVHQNASNMSAHDKNMRNQNTLVEQLNAMTKAAAQLENKEADTKFTDVMKCDPDKDIYYIPGLWHGTPPMARVNHGYSEAVYDLKKSLLNMLKSDEVKCHDAIGFRNWTSSLWNAVKFENFVLRKVFDLREIDKMGREVMAYLQTCEGQSHSVSLQMMKGGFHSDSDAIRSSKQVFDYWSDSSYSRPGQYDQHPHPVRNAKSFEFIPPFMGGESPGPGAMSELSLVLLGGSATGMRAAGNIILGAEEFGRQASTHTSTEGQHSESRQREMAGRRCRLQTGSAVESLRRT